MVQVLFFGRRKCSYTHKALVHLTNLGFVVTHVESEKRGQSIPEDVAQWEGEYIFCFRSYYILPKILIDRAAIAAINFHPAPVEYPGSGCLNFALYDEVELYGVTAHLMNEKIDDGKIIECRRFPIFSTDDVDSLLQRTHHKLMELFSDTTSGLYVEGKEYIRRKLGSSKEERWNGPSRGISELERLRTVDVNSSEKELERIIRATHTDDFPTRICLHGHSFHLRK